VFPPNLATVQKKRRTQKQARMPPEKTNKYTEVEQDGAIAKHTQRGNWKHQIRYTQSGGDEVRGL